jgi:hypothetical protein
VLAGDLMVELVLASWRWDRIAYVAMSHSPSCRTRVGTSALTCLSPFPSLSTENMHMVFEDHIVTGRSARKHSKSVEVGCDRIYRMCIRCPG